MSSPDPQNDSATDPTSDPIQDETVAAAVAGSRDALDRLLLAHGPRLQVMVAGRLRGSRDRLEMGQDIAQDILLDLATEIRTIDPPTEGELKRVLARIVDVKVESLREAPHSSEGAGGSIGEARLVPADLRSRANLQPVWRSVSRDGRTPETLTEQREALTIFLEELDALSPEHREVVIGSVFDQISTRELAKRLGDKRTAVAMRIARALEALTKRVRRRMKTPFTSV